MVEGRAAGAELAALVAQIARARAGPAFEGAGERRGIGEADEVGGFVDRRHAARGFGCLSFPIAIPRADGNYGSAV